MRGGGGPLRVTLSGGLDLERTPDKRRLKTERVEVVTRRQIKQVVAIEKTHRRSQDFVWGALFLIKKADDLFLVVALKERLNIPPNLTRPAKTVLKLTPALAGGALRVLGDALTHFPCKLRLKFFFTALGCRCTHCTPGYAYVRMMTKKVVRFLRKNRVTP